MPDERPDIPEKIFCLGKDEMGFCLSTFRNQIDEFPFVIFLFLKVTAQEQSKLPISGRSKMLVDLYPGKGPVYCF